MRLIKRLWYRLWLWNALHSIGEVREDLEGNGLSTRREKMLGDSLLRWEAKAAKWRARVDDLDAPDNECEQLSRRAVAPVIAPLFWTK